MYLTNMLKFIIGIGVFSLLFLGGSYVLLSKTTATPQAQALSYAPSDKDKPKAEVQETYKDVGKISVKSTQEVDFVIKNTGTKPLQLIQITSSCGCTTGKIIYNGKETKEYGMHSKTSELVEIAPNTQATMRMIYRPFTMPVYGIVTRDVYVSTNDPQNPKLTFQIKTFVE